MLRIFEELKYHLKIDNSIYFHSLVIFDKYLESIKNDDKKEDMILLVITSLFLSNKFENQNKDYIEESIIDHLGKRKIGSRKKYYSFEVFDTELKILQKLNYSIYFPTVYSFYVIGTKMILDKEEEMLLKISYLNYEIVKNFKPSIISMSISKIKQVIKNKINYNKNVNDVLFFK